MSFTAASTQSSELQKKILQYKPDNLAMIIGKLAGDKNNLKVDIQQLKFCLGKTKFEVNGEVNFNVIYKKPNANAKP
jgi:hypothetical protein